ncbi:Gfo/Idh/MocA family protein [Rufibacter psychrotolerans]|uniref:Gfo/Idh/MocA family protein n=1 Tax=Rufibacter psychrotolerans TaxID=2812556 RepID=UPI0019676DC8|nr:Gfo/Idh/MocA family oxidoreductase [Rufibacter sp. SYSU D00308]
MKKNQPRFLPDRRSFLKGFSLVLGSTAFGFPFFSFGSCQKGGGSGTPAENPGAPGGQGTAKKLGIALVGLGNYSENQLAPALQETQHCYLAGIVTGTPSKIDRWKARYNLPDKNIYNYQNFDQIANNPDIDVVYIVLPNSMHAEYTIRAARAKKHVICEKPMATTVEDAQRMLEACRQNNVHLSIGYRLHFEPFNKRVMELGQKQVFGKVQSIEARNGFDITRSNPNVWRLDKELAGGGPLMDMGIYCVQGACYTLGKPPVAVTARFGEVTHKDYFDEVEQSISWQMEFADGVIAHCSTSYAENQSLLAGKAEKGWWRVEPAFWYSGKKGETSQGKMDLPEVYEQVLQMDAQALSFKNNQTSIVPGEMGLRDVKILLAIYESARNNGKRVPIS